MAREWTRKSIEELARSVYGRMGGGGSSTHIVPYTFGDARADIFNNGNWYKSGVFSGDNIVGVGGIFFDFTRYGRFRTYDTSTLPAPIVEMSSRADDIYRGFSCVKGGTLSDPLISTTVRKYLDPEYFFQLSIVLDYYKSSLINYLQNLSGAATTFLGSSLTHFTAGSNLAEYSDGTYLGRSITIPIVKYVGTVKVYTYNKNAVLENLSRGSNLETFDSDRNVVGIASDYPSEYLHTAMPYIWLPTNTVFLSYLQHITSEWSTSSPTGIMFLHIPSNCWGEMTVEEIVNKIFSDFPIVDDSYTVTIDSYT